MSKIPWLISPLNIPFQALRKQAANKEHEDLEPSSGGHSGSPDDEPEYGLNISENEEEDGGGPQNPSPHDASASESGPQVVSALYYANLSTCFMRNSFF